MDRFVAALAEPWSRKWIGQAAGAALAFWSAGLVIWLLRWPPSTASCRGWAAVAGPWCAAHDPAAVGAAAALTAGVLAGSTVLVAAIAPGLLRLLAGEAWPWQGRRAAVCAPVLRWLILRQVDARGRAAAAGRPVSGLPPPVSPGPGARQRAHQAIAADAVLARVDQAAAARLRRYPPGNAAAPTRIGSAMAAMAERIWQRHRLDLPVCWEPILAVLPGDAREALTRESTRLTRRAQNLIWGGCAAAWAVLLGWPWAILAWLLAVAVLCGLLYGSLREAAETYCDLIEAIVMVHRPRLYRGLGLALPESPAAEIVTGAALSAYLSGAPPADLGFSWPAADGPGRPAATASPPAPAAAAAAAAAVLMTGEG